MALALAAGVAFATVLTLVLIPSLMAILNDFRLLAHWIRHGYWPRRVAVEPARFRYVDLYHETPVDEVSDPVSPQGHLASVGAGKPSG